MDMTAITARFQRMAEEIEKRENKYAEIIDFPGYESGPCPQCGTFTPLDREKSLEESCREGEAQRHYKTCNPCQDEARAQGKLAGAGVPSRVQAATFANYEIYETRQADAVRKIRDWTEDAPKTFLVILGDCGTGKGHLASSAARYFVDQSIRWRTHNEFIGHCHALDFHARENYLDTLAASGLLIFDEMGGRTMTADTPEIFYLVLDRRYDKGLKTILIGNIPLRSDGQTSILSLTGHDRMESRIAESGVVVTCQWPDFRRRNKDKGK